MRRCESRFGSQTLQSRLAAQRKKEEKTQLEESNMSGAQAAGGAARWGMSSLDTEFLQFCERQFLYRGTLRGQIDFKGTM